mmetsp:Transcript_59728/g.153826  ORF Transcript_59728/g.153826 Transcript_59728/m.153826 type:complete len:316 (-) Transcript_59728:151-1098(-)
MPAKASTSSEASSGIVTTVSSRDLAELTPPVACASCSSTAIEAFCTLSSACSASSRRLFQDSSDCAHHRCAASHSQRRRCSSASRSARVLVNSASRRLFSCTSLWRISARSRSLSAWDFAASSRTALTRTSASATLRCQACCASSWLRCILPFSSLVSLRTLSNSDSRAVRAWTHSVTFLRRCSCAWRSSATARSLSSFCGAAAAGAEPPGAPRDSRAPARDGVGSRLVRKSGWAAVTAGTSLIMASGGSDFADACTDAPPSMTLKSTGIEEMLLSMMLVQLPSTPESPKAFALKRPWLALRSRSDGRMEAQSQL